MTALWLTTHVGGTTVQHTNAVVINHDDDRCDQKIYALTADRIVILTDGSVEDGVFQHALGVDVLGDLIAETEKRQQLIQKATAEYMTRTKNKNLVIPDFLSLPNPPSQSHAAPELRALATANYIAEVWSGWLATEEQRLRRTIEPRTGASPWIMPEQLAAQEMSIFPEGFGQRVRPEPLKKF